MQDQAPVRIAVPVIGTDGAPPARYRAILATDRDVFRVTCPGSPPDGPLRCTDTGVSVPETGELTLKAHGYAFVTRDVTDVTDGVVLAALAPFEANDDYRTGFDAQGADAFRAFAVSADTEIGQALSVKFTLRDVDTAEPRVYFQNTVVHPLHYDFARTVLGIPLGVAEFEAATYHGENRTGMAGTLIAYPGLSIGADGARDELIAPVVLSFFPSDDLTPAQAQRAHAWLEERLWFSGIDGAVQRLVYLPAGSKQESELAADASVFTHRESLFTTREAIYAGLVMQALNPGVAYGTLRLLAPESLASTPVSYRDIAVLPRLPNDLPILGGTITEELQTPLAHVNLAAHARGTPNLALVGASTDPRVEPWFDRIVRFEVVDGGFSLTAATPEDAQAFWVSEQRPRFVPESDLIRTDLPRFEEFGFADWRSFGVKAANLAELRRLLGDLVPTGFGVPFSAHASYMAGNAVTAERCAAARSDCTVGGRAADACDRAVAHCTAGAVAGDTFAGLADRIVSDAEVAADTPLRDACLAELSYLIATGTVDPVFASRLDARVAEIFGADKVRLRSSTNSEDLVDFNGAGLYESVSAYAAGDQRASLAIRRVWASVWRFKAFEERSFWNVDHRAVYMGVAVNRAYTDEVANGVLITQNVVDPNTAGMYVNVQQGEVSVTNPSDGALPEAFSIVPAPSGGVQVARTRFSSLSPALPLLSDSEISALYLAAERVQRHFAPLYALDPSVLALDLEFKFHGAARALVIKQARPYSAGY